MKIAIHGYGAMGKIVDELAGERGIDVVARIGSETTDTLSGLAVTPDVVIDFSNPARLAELLDYGVRTQVPLVIATTGFSEEQLHQIERAAQQIPIFQSYNTSYGIALLKQLLDQIVPLTTGFDVEIIEAHHRKKVDAPSGTAELLARTVQQQRPVRPVYERHSSRQMRAHDELGMHAIRGGTIFGEHTVLFAGEDEVIELKHTALSKRVFANGALAAAMSLLEKPAGKYDLTNVYEEADHATNERL